MRASSPLEYLTAFTVTFLAGAATSAAMTAYMAKVKRDAQKQAVEQQASK
jgi:hypothetical protein